MMPTKKRLAKEREKKKRDEAFAVLPEHLVGADLSLNEIVQKDIGFYCTNLCKHDENGEPYKAVLHPEKPSNDKSADERRAEAFRLKEKYPDHWCRSGAKWIAGEKGVSMGVRAIQKYIKDFP